MMFAVYSKIFNGWVICELRQIAGRIEQVPISVPYKTEDEANHVMHTVYEMREKLHLL